MRLENTETGQVEDVAMREIGKTEDGETVYAPREGYELPQGFYLDGRGDWVEKKSRTASEQLEEWLSQYRKHQ